MLEKFKYKSLINNFVSWDTKLLIKYKKSSFVKPKASNFIELVLNIKQSHI